MRPSEAGPALSEGRLCLALLVYDSPGTQCKSTNECHPNWVGPVSAELVYQVLDAR